MTRVAAASLALMLSCSACRESAAPADGSVQGPPAANVSVSLPDGWVAQLEADQSFRAGPPGRPVLRIDYRKGAAGTLPPIDAMRREFEQALGRSATVVENVDRPDLRLLVLAVGGGDGGSAPVLVGARASGNDLFLCATEPGATQVEVTSAREACEALRASGDVASE